MKKTLLLGKSSAICIREVHRSKNHSKFQEIRNHRLIYKENCLHLNVYQLQYFSSSLIQIRPIKADLNSQLNLHNFINLNHSLPYLSMESSRNHQESVIPLLCISSIKKSKNWTLAETERYDRQHKSRFLHKSHTSASNLKCKINKPPKKLSENNLTYLKINTTLDYIASNLIPIPQPKHKKNLSLMLQRLPQNKQKWELGDEPLRKISEKRQKKAKLLTQLITNYKIHKSKSKNNLKEQNCYFPTQLCDTLDLGRNLTAREQKHQSLESKDPNQNVKSKRKQPEHSFPCDPELKMIVSHELSKLWKLKSKANAKINEFNLVNYYERANYEHRIKNIKMAIKK